MFLYHGDMDLEWAAYPEGTDVVCDHFCRGLNAYVDGVRGGRFPRPPEFSLLGMEPALWSKDDIVRIRSNALSANAVSELRRTVLRSEGRHGADALRGRLWPKIEPEHAADIADADAIIRLLELARAPVVITRERLDAKIADIEEWSDPGTWLSDAVPVATSMDGSNNWAISGNRTASGKPILANDPHRALQNPSLRYAVQLSGPNFSVIGAGEPSLPGISIGHNGKVAFGLTIFPADQEDVFCFDLSRNDPASGSVVACDDVVEVKGGHRVRFTFHRLGSSPVLRLDAGGRSGIALRTVWSEPGAAPYLGSLSLLDADNVADFRARLRTWRLPAVNYVAADLEGTIGWFVAGALPKRLPPASGTVPQLADDDPWTGFVDEDTLPMRVDPPCGFVLSANERNVQADWVDDYGAPTREWFEPFRALRISEVLADDARATVEASERLQADTHSIAARELQRRVRKAVDRTGPLDLSEQASGILRWSCEMASADPIALFYEFWVDHHLKPRARAAVDTEILTYLDVSIEALIDFLDRLPARSCDALLRDSLTEADRCFAPLRKQALFRHAIQDDVTNASFHIGPVPWDGSDTTVNFGKRSSGGSFVEWGASFRMVVDLADPDNSRWSNRPHTDRLAPDGAMLPMLYSVEGVTRAVVHEIKLKPLNQEH